MNYPPRIPEVAKLERLRANQLAQERRQRCQWYWLSFVNKGGFLGAAILWAHGIETAVLRARELNISSGFRGEVPPERDEMAAANNASIGKRARRCGVAALALELKVAGTRRRSANPYPLQR
jgi:hypothetical protein